MIDGSPPPSASAATVLIVEDDRDLSDLLVQLLTLEGYSVSAVDNGRDALDYLNRLESPRLILLDLMMPIIDGVEFLRRRRGNPRLRAVPVVVLSALDRAGAAEFCDVEYLEKPLDFERLLALVHRHCQPR